MGVLEIEFFHEREEVAQPRQVMSEQEERHKGEDRCHEKQEKVGSTV